MEKKGYLYKLGTKERAWNLRYFVLRPGVFTYAKDPQGKVTEVVKLKRLQVFYAGAGKYTTARLSGILVNKGFIGFTINRPGCVKSILDLDPASRCYRSEQTGRLDWCTNLLSLS